jgi:hypothetical protein
MSQGIGEAGRAPPTGRCIGRTVNHSIVANFKQGFEFIHLLSLAPI